MLYPTYLIYLPATNGFFAVSRAEGCKLFPIRQGGLVPGGLATLMDSDDSLKVRFEIKFKHILVF